MQFQLTLQECLAAFSPCGFASEVPHRGRGDLSTALWSLVLLSAVLRDRSGQWPFLAILARFCLAQPSLTICLARPSASDSAGTSSVMQEAAPTYEPLPSLTGATRVASLPTKTPSSITVLNLLAP